MRTAAQEPDSVTELGSVYLDRRPDCRLHFIRHSEICGRVGLDGVDGQLPYRELTLSLDDPGWKLDAVKILVVGIRRDNGHVAQYRIGFDGLDLRDHIVAVDSAGHCILAERTEGNHVAAGVAVL